MINLTRIVGIPLHSCCFDWDPTTLLFHLLVVLVGIPPLFTVTADAVGIPPLSCSLELKHVWYGCLFVGIPPFHPLSLAIHPITLLAWDFMVGISLHSSLHLVVLILFILTVATNAVFQNVFHCQFCSGSNANSVIR